MIYLYVTPEGLVNLIEGDKMPVKPEDHPNVKSGMDQYSEPLETNGFWQQRLKNYEDELAAAKASSVPIDNLEQAKEIILKSGATQLMAETIYGPFGVSFEIQSRCCANENLAIGMCERDCEAYESYQKIKGPNKVAILLPEKSPEVEHGPSIKVMGQGFHINKPPRKWEPVGKLEEKEESPEDLAVTFAMYMSGKCTVGDQEFFREIFKKGHWKTYKIDN